MQVVILAGGLGTRLRPLTLSVPKPMVLVAGKPFLEYEILNLKRGGFRNFVICTGYRTEAIEEYFGDGSKIGVSIDYSRDGDSLLGPAGALKHAAKLIEEQFMVTYGDSFLRIDFSAFKKAFRSSGKLGMMSVLENHDEFGKSDIVVRGGLVTDYNKSNQKPGMNWINYGATMLQKNALNFIPDSTEVGEEQFYWMLIERGELAAFVTPNRFYEIGTLSGLSQFRQFLAQNPVNFLAQERPAQ